MKILLSTQTPEPDLVLDNMLLDSDVVGCDSPFHIMNVDTGRFSSSVLSSNDYADSGKTTADNPDVRNWSSCNNIGLDEKNSMSCSKFKALNTELQVVGIPSLVLLPILSSPGLEGPSSKLIVSDPVDLDSEKQEGDITSGGCKGYNYIPVDIIASFLEGKWSASLISIFISCNLFDKVGLEAILYRFFIPSNDAQERLRVSPSSYKLSEIKIIDNSNEDRSVELLGESQGATTFYIKPCKFFLYYFLAAFRHRDTLLPPVKS